jgi:hypothetical protein
LAGRACRPRQSGDYWIALVCTRSHFNKPTLIVFNARRKLNPIEASASGVFDGRCDLRFSRYAHSRQRDATKGPSAQKACAAQNDGTSRILRVSRFEVAPRIQKRYIQILSPRFVDSTPRKPQSRTQSSVRRTITPHRIGRKDRYAGGRSSQRIVSPLGELARFFQRLNFNFLAI